MQGGVGINKRYLGLFFLFERGEAWELENLILSSTRKLKAALSCDKVTENNNRTWCHRVPFIFSSFYRRCWPCQKNTVYCPIGVVPRTRSANKRFIQASYLIRHTFSVLIWLRLQVRVHFFGNKKNGSRCGCFLWFILGGEKWIFKSFMKCKTV